jgi:hypothetical protein
MFVFALLLSIVTQDGCLAWWLFGRFWREMVGFISDLRVLYVVEE